MKKLPIGIQTFSHLIDDDYLYIDKTENIFNLLEEGGKYYFLSRPRRFGKSLLVSTLREIFSGNKELFKGLWIYDKLDWQQHPVIHLDFLGLEYGTRKDLIKSLEYLVNKNAAHHGIQLQADGYDKRFKELISGLSKKNKVVILVDEYDKPIIDFVDKPEIAEVNRKVLKTFYGSIKGGDEYLRFAFITGVSKFSKVSVFSDLNNLRDITVSNLFSTILGYTHGEFLHYFSNRIEEMAGNKKDGKEELIGDIKSWYNGYSWDGENFLYNPLSILNFFQEKKFGNYWFETGTTSFLMKLIKNYEVDVKELDNYKSGEAIFDSFEPDHINVVSLLFQTGYLTLKNVESIDRVRYLYTFSYPNIEVKEAFMENLLGYFSSRFPNEVSVIIYE